MSETESKIEQEQEGASILEESGESGPPSSPPASEHFPRGTGVLLRVSEQEGRSLWGVVCALSFLLALGVSYLDEDAFISFRVVDNFVNGYGLRWNISERVQVYTNPLWVLLLSVVQAMVRDIAWTSYLLSAAAATAAISVIARPLQRRPVLLAVFLLPLLLSQAFTDYTSSGLENPLLYLFSALFIERLYRPDAFTEEERRGTFLFLSLFAALSATTRADTFLLFAPTLLWLCVIHRRRLPIGKITLGALPLLLWLGFAYIYYGTIFPNPKYAKLDGGIPRSVYLEFGWTYLRDMARNDVVTFLGLVSAPLVAAFGVLGTQQTKRVIGRPAVLLAAGASLYIAYVVWVGGDFMAGRYWSTPFFFVVCAMSLQLASLAGSLREDELGELAESMPASLSPPLVGNIAGAGRYLLYTAAVLLAARFVVQPITMERDVIAHREQGRFAIVREGEIRDQRFNCGFFEALFSKRGDPSKHSWSQQGLKEARRAAAHKERKPESRYIVVNSAAGKTAFYAGPLVEIVDPLAITDPLLARLPDADGEMRLIGHLKRNVPRGYIDAREDGDTSKMDPYLKKYWDALSLVTRGPLFDKERLLTMFRMTGGAYDHLLEHYIEHGDKSVRRRMIHGHF